MASGRSLFLAICFSAVLLLNASWLTRAAGETEDADLEEDLAFLTSEESGETHDVDQDHLPLPSDGLEDYDDFTGGGATEYEEQEEDAWPAVDEKDVVVLKKGNFSEFVKNNSHVLVEFYAPWCGHCRALAPDYAAAATELKGSAALAKVDGTEEMELAEEYNIQGFPTLYHFFDGKMQKTYDGDRRKDAIVDWMKKKTGPSIHNITTTEAAEKILAEERTVVLGFLDSLVGSESEELAAAARLEDGVSFYQTACPDVAKLFQIESETKRPVVVLLKKEEEKFNRFDGDFTRSSIAEFVSINKMPLVISFTKETAQLVFDSLIKHQLYLFTTSNDTDKYISGFKDAAKAHKGKFVFVYVQIDNEDFGEAVTGFFGLSGNDPRVLVYTGEGENKKYFLDGELNSNSIKTFAEHFLAGKLKPFYKSDPVPASNDEDVKIVVGHNFDEIVLDESKDVLLEIYAPWCGHCQAFEPIYKKLGKHLKGIDSLVLAKMDGTSNEHPRAKADAFPTLIFFPAGNKTADPITVETDLSVVELYKFLKKNASIPFKLQRPASPEPTIIPKEGSEVGDGTAETENFENYELKDEL